MHNNLNEKKVKLINKIIIMVNLIITINIYIYNEPL